MACQIFGNKAQIKGYIIACYNIISQKIHKGQNHLVDCRSIRNHSVIDTGEPCNIIRDR